MWDWFNKIAGQIVKYSTFFGQIWYIIVFVFRLIVVATLGSSVYNDEQSAFTCSTEVIGCQNVCFNEFAKISHLRFWAFQLLGITTPVVAFHFFSLFITGQIAKIDSAKKLLSSSDNDEVLSGSGDGFRSHAQQEAYRQMQRRQRMVGKVREKRVFDGDKVEEIPVTNAIQIAYFVTTIFRAAVEGAFIALGYQFYFFYNPICDGSLVQSTEKCEPEYTASHLVWQTVPAIFVCHPDLSAEVITSCSQHFFLGGRTGFVPCFVSRSYEKTVFLRYMNFLSVICFCLCLAELVYIPIRFIFKKQRKTRRASSYKYPTDYTLHPVHNHHDMYYLENNPLQRPPTTLSSIQQQPANMVVKNNKIQTIDNPKYDDEAL